MQSLNIGISPCPNDIFIFSGILLNQIDTDGLNYQFTFQDVENLNLAVSQNELDGAKISVAAYPKCETNYSFLPCGGALGRGVGPLLLSQNGEWKPENVTLSPGEFTTANALLAIYAKAHATHTPLKLRYLPFDALYAELCSDPHSQGVVIHEKRFTYQNDALKLIADLGEFWEKETGKPIPLGGFVVKRDLHLEETVTQQIRASLTWAYSNYEQAFSLCREYAQDLAPGVVESHISLYVNPFSMDLGLEGHEAVRYFLDSISDKRELAEC